MGGLVHNWGPVVTGIASPAAPTTTRSSALAVAARAIDGRSPALGETLTSAPHTRRSRSGPVLERVARNHAAQRGRVGCPDELLVLSRAGALPVDTPERSAEPWQLPDARRSVQSSHWRRWVASRMLVAGECDARRHPSFSRPRPQTFEPQRRNQDCEAPGQRSDPAELGVVNVGVGRGAIPSSIPCICPGRSDFSWSWGESNPSADVCVVPGQGLSSLATIRFRVSVSDRHLPGMAGV